MTRYQEEVLAALEASTAISSHDGGEWERSYETPRSPAESRAMAALYQLGLVEREPGRPSAKIPHRYRAKTPPLKERR